MRNLIAPKETLAVAGSRANNKDLHFKLVESEVYNLLALQIFVLKNNKNGIYEYSRLDNESIKLLLDRNTSKYVVEDSNKDVRIGDRYMMFGSKITFFTNNGKARLSGSFSTDINVSKERVEREKTSIKDAVDEFLRG